MIKLNFDELKVKDAIYIETKILELSLCKKITCEQDLINIKGKCEVILQKLKKYEEYEEDPILWRNNNE